MPDPTTRIVHDLLGDKAVPADAYYGAQTARALENFRISGVPLHLYPDVIRGFAMVKMAAARANCACGVFDAAVLGGIEAACQDLIDVKLHDQFNIDVFQGGAGTSTNMNANEVIANRALEHMGFTRASTPGATLTARRPVPATARCVADVLRHREPVPVFGAVADGHGGRRRQEVEDKPPSPCCRISRPCSSVAAS
jgi:hypothetical protein